MSHTFVSYKVKGGEANETNIKTNISEDTFSIENLNTGEVIATAQLSNRVDPKGCTVSYSARIIEIKLKKEDGNIQWGALEMGKVVGGIS
jgi:hypothetical protein